MPIPATVFTSGGPPREAEEPKRGISFLDWKFLGLRPRTTMGAVVVSQTLTFASFARVATTSRCKVKCCWSSRLRPLLAVAILNCKRLYEMGYTEKSAFPSGPLTSSGCSGMAAGSCSWPCPTTSGDFGGGVFQGITISFTAWPSTDSVAEMVTSIEEIATLSPLSVITDKGPRGVVAVPDIWKRLRR